MRKRLICLLISTCLPGLAPGIAMADSTSDQIKMLEKQLYALQKQVKSLTEQVAADQASRSSQAAATAAPAAAMPNTLASVDYGAQPATLTNDEVAAMKQQMAKQQMKVDSLSDAAETGPLAGLSVTGYIDPTYMYNRAGSGSSFLFANHNGAYNYYDSTFGDIYLDIKKTFGIGPMAPSAEITLMPNRGNGITLMQDERGSYAADILNTAVINVPLNESTTFVAGLVPSFGGYEVQQSNMMTTLTHNLLYDFSDPGSYVGIGFNYTSGNWASKFFIGNEQYRTYGSITQTGSNALGDDTSTSNRIPTITARTDYTWSSALDLGASINIGRQTLASASAGSYGVAGMSSTPYGMYYFTEADATFTTADITYNAELDYGQESHAAFNGGQAQWYGISLLANRKFSVPGVGRMGVTARYDFLDDSKNGGGGGGIALDSSGRDTADGFGISSECLATSEANGGAGLTCRGTNRQDVALDLLFYPTQQITVKVEYRHDWANGKVFLRNDGSYSASNDLLATQFIYSF